ncbi:hypothetical protein EXS71_01270 [Candidatus Uhrbacteria bacterium]|nr:hypothetical protein [Candidatus Uhrbacteria bacterium]
MAWLFVDTHAPFQSRVGWLATGKKREIKTLTGRRGRILFHLAPRWRTYRKNLEGICVVSGPGSFSAIRGGVLTANLLARFMRVPLVGISVDQAQDLFALETELLNQRLPVTQYVAPQYDAEPNITLPSHS